MKNFITFILLLALVFSLCACGNTVNKIESTPEPTIEPTPEPTPTPVPPLQVDGEGNFEFLGQTFNVNNEYWNLSHVEMTLADVSTVKEMMFFMPNLKGLDMDSCGKGDDFDIAMADIRDSYPNVSVVWRIWFGEGGTYTVRTDVEKILASLVGNCRSSNCKSLKYCTKVKYLDLGHNNDMDDISFVKYMPDLQIAILAMGVWTDASPLANCKKLEYAELQTTGLSDLTPLSGLTNLKHLNICYNMGIWDITPLYNLTNLERLWIGKLDPVPQEQIDELKSRIPGCTVNNTTVDPTGGDWRYVFNAETGTNDYDPYYAYVREVFNYSSSPACYSLPQNDPLY